MVGGSFQFQVLGLGIWVVLGHEGYFFFLGGGRGVLGLGLRVWVAEFGSFRFRGLEFRAWGVSLFCFRGLRVGLL